MKPNEQAERIGTLVRAARDAAGLNNTTLAAAVGMPRRTIVRIANGKNVPETATLERIARATGKPLDYFVGGGSRNGSARIHALLDDLVGELMVEVRASVAADGAVEVEA